MSTQLHSMTHGAAGFGLAYTVMLLAILAGLAHARASWGKYLLSPLVAVAMTVFAGIVIAITSSPLRVLGIDKESILQLLFGVSVTVVMGYAAGRVLAARGGASSAPTHRRGAMVTAALRGSTVHDAGITLAGVPIPLEDETKHFKIIGTTGTGKSTAIREILTGALARGDRAIIADPDGAYAGRFYDPDRGDVILNPFQSDGRKWDLFAEVVNSYDIDQLARSLIPDSGDPDRVWSEYARTFFGAVMRQMIRTGNRDARELLRVVTTAPLDELRTLLAGTAAVPFLDVEKMFGSLRSVASSAIKVLEFILEQEAASFSVRQWVREGKPRHAGGLGGVLFIPYTAGEIAALRSVISAWMRLGIFQAMDREEGDQRLWFVVDELDALGEIDGLKDALARVRKFGGRCILGLQSISQVSGTYGKSAAETIVENCGNTYILRSSASEHGGTSEFASKLIGQREVMHTTLATTRQSRWHWKTSITTSQQIRTEAAVMASEIERLPDLTGFLKLASLPDWQLATLSYKSAPNTVSWRPSTCTSSPTPPAASSASATATPSPTSSVPTASTSSAPSARTSAASATRYPAAAYAPKPTSRKGKPRSEKGHPRTSARTRIPEAPADPTSANASVHSRAEGAQLPHPNP